MNSQWGEGRRFFISGVIFQKSGPIKKPDSVLLTTPNFQLLLRARPKIIPTSPYDILLKNISPCALRIKAKLLLECSLELWESR